MRFLVTGGTGFVGRYVVRRLRKSGHDVLLYARSTSDTREAASLGADIFRGDLLDFERIKEAVRKAQIVIHVGEIGLSVKNAVRLNVDLLKAMMEAARGRPDFRSLILVSSITVVAPPQFTPANEQTPQRNFIRDRYTIYKRRCEEILQSSDIPSSIVRGGMIYGPGANYLLIFFNLLRRMRWVGLPFPGRLDLALPSIHAADFANVLIEAGLQTDRQTEIYNAVDDDGIRLRSFVNLMGELVGQRFRLIPLPMWLQGCMSKCMDWGFGLFRLPQTAVAIIDFLTNDNIFSNEKILKKLGISLAYPTIREGLPETAAWMMSCWKK